MNFAVRLDGALIGEVVLYRFDSRGGAELGCRVSPGFAGHGYGTEAFAAVADWALYRLHLAHAGLSPEEQQRLVSGAKSLRTPDEVASYVWDYLDRQGR